MSDPKTASMFDGPARYRHRALELARAREQIRQACALAQKAGAALAELGFDHQLDLKTAIRCATEASNQLMDAEANLDAQIARTPIV